MKRWLICCLLISRFGLQDTLAQEYDSFDEAKSICERIGFAPKTTKYQECVLELNDRAQGQASNRTPPTWRIAPQQSVTPLPSLARPAENTATDYLELAIDALNFAAGKTGEPTQSGVHQRGVVCVLQSGIQSGLYRNCLYRCPGGQVSRSTGAATICPISIRQ